jgi:release factor glutamine methyltransferase
MAEFHMLPSLKKESELMVATGSKNEEDATTPYDAYEQWLIRNWDEWNEQAIQRTSDHAMMTTATMPSLDHLTYQDFQEVYEPSDDTYLLLDAIQYDLSATMLPNDDDENDNSARLRDTSNTTTATTIPICLEIGCGSGVVSVYFRSLWLQQQRRCLLSYVTDINPKALQITYRTFQQAMKCTEQKDIAELSGTSVGQQQRQTTNDGRMGHVEYILCDIATPLLQQLSHRVTYIICNPPYVPTCDSEIGPTDITAAYAGGTNGRRIIDRIIPQIIQLLHVPNGIAYFVTVDENLPLQLAIYIYRQQKEQEKLGHSSTHRILQMKPFFRKRTKNEFLTIQKITYIDPNCIKDV